MTPWTVACQAPLLIGFLRQEPWTGLSFPSSGDLPNAGIESALADGPFTAKQPGKYDCVLHCTYEKCISQVANVCVCVCACAHIHTIYAY